MVYKRSVVCHSNNISQPRLSPRAASSCISARIRRLQTVYSFCVCVNMFESSAAIVLELVHEQLRAPHQLIVLGSYADVLATLQQNHDESLWVVRILAIQYSLLTVEVRSAAESSQANVSRVRIIAATLHLSGKVIG